MFIKSTAGRVQSCPGLTLAPPSFPESPGPTSRPEVPTEGSALHRCGICYVLYGIFTALFLRVGVFRYVSTTVLHLPAVFCSVTGCMGVQPGSSGLGRPGSCEPPCDVRTAQHHARMRFLEGAPCAVGVTGWRVQLALPPGGRVRPPLGSPSRRPLSTPLRGRPVADLTSLREWAGTLFPGFAVRKNAPR